MHFTNTTGALASIIFLWLCTAVFPAFGQTCPTGTMVDGGLISLTEGGRDSTSRCVGNGLNDSIAVTLSGDMGDSSVWVITDTAGVILDLPSGPPFNLENAGPGTCLIWHLSYTSPLGGATVGGSADSLTGCFDLSNPITVKRNAVEGGTLSFTDGTDSLTICAGDGTPDPFEVTLSTDTLGANRAWVVTDSSLNILDLPPGPTFDLEGAGVGICYLWYLSFAEGLGGAEVGESAADLVGCFDLSNRIVVTRDTGANCAPVAVRDDRLDPTSVTLFPNPVGRTLTVELNGLTAGEAFLQVLDVNGRQLRRSTVSASDGRYPIELGQLPTGTYLLRVTHEAKSLTRRFVKQE